MASHYGVALDLDGEHLIATSDGSLPPDLRALIHAHRAELVQRLAAVGLSAEVRRRFREACARLRLDDPGPVLRQFDLWRYPGRDLREMLGWPDSTVEEHCRLLAHEVGRGMTP